MIKKEKGRLTRAILAVPDCALTGTELPAKLTATFACRCLWPVMMLYICDCERTCVTLACGSIVCPQQSIKAMSTQSIISALEQPSTATSAPNANGTHCQHDSFDRCVCVCIVHIAYCHWWLQTHKHTHTQTDTDTHAGTREVAETQVAGKEERWRASWTASHCSKLPHKVAVVD